MQIEKILNLKEFKKWLTKNVGKCPDYSWDCFTCRSWRLYDEIKGYVDFNTILEKEGVKNKEARPHK